ncbi:MAG: glycoside hydrolase family 3 N-terminal domain-containing protein [Bacteroidota bacterium]
MSKAQDVSFPWFDETKSFEERAGDLVKAMTLEEKISQTLDNSPAIPRLGVPAYVWWNEALHGVARNGRATVFPQAIGMAASFDPDLMKRVAEVISTEARAKFNASVAIGNRGQYAGLTFWSPNVNIFRDPRWGRGQETYGEDPYLTSQMGVAFVEGIQGNHPKYLKAAACAKHYLVHSGPEELRHEFDAISSAKDLQETYLPAFEALVKDANVEGVMGAYNRVNGEVASGSRYFLTELLKEKWGFDGYIVSDCGAISDFHRFHKVTKTPAESAALALKSGLHLNCGNVYKQLGNAIEQGLLTEEELDASLIQLFLTRFKLGFFDPRESNPFNDVDESVVDSKEHREVAYEIAAKSIVMLKNENVLPLSRDIKSLYVLGPHASSEEILLGNYYGLSGNTVSILDGIVSNVSAGTSINYKMGVLPYRENVNPIDWSTGEAKRAEAMIAVMGLSGLYEGEEGESIASSTKGDRVDIKLPQNQIDYLKKLKGDSETPLILILTGGSPVALPELEDIVDAILFVWYPGEEGGSAVADVLFGNVSPSGKLPITFPYSVDDLPPFEDYNMAGRTYKYMEKEPQFPFGYGLSYADFQFGAPTMKQNKKSVAVSVPLSNQGEVEGTEVVQLYVSSPNAGSGDPISDLKTFKRLNLGGKEASTIEFELDYEDFLVVDENGDRVIRKGDYTIWLGNASPGSRSKELGSQFVKIDFDPKKLRKK